MATAKYHLPITVEVAAGTTSFSWVQLLSSDPTLLLPVSLIPFPAKLLVLSTHRAHFNQAQIPTNTLLNCHCSLRATQAGKNTNSLGKDLENPRQNDLGLHWTLLP